MDKLTDLTAIPVVMGLVEVFKLTGLPTRFAPLVSLVLGIGAGLVLNPENLLSGAISGIFFGLAASGSYNHIKNVNPPAVNPTTVVTP